jgi:alpha-tubulin suppressor-like RCC1 family protein
LGSTSGNRSYALSEDGRLWGWGQNGGLLGDGTTASHLTPFHVATNRTWVAVNAGESHTVAIADDGTLWAWGINSFGEVGDGTTSRRFSPVQAVANVQRTWEMVTAGSSHTLALTSDGVLWGWGVNPSGVLGDGTTGAQIAPVPVATNLARSWVAVSSGGSHTLALASDGTLWSWGANDSGQLGNGAPTTYFAPFPLVTNLPQAWSAISGGEAHTLALATNGTLWGWGHNDYGQLGDGTSMGRLVPGMVAINLNRTWSAISVGFSHTLALATDGTLWGWGHNDSGQLGDGGRYRASPDPVRVDRFGNKRWISVSTGGGAAVHYSRIVVQLRIDPW